MDKEHFGNGCLIYIYIREKNEGYTPIIDTSHISPGDMNMEKKIFSYTKLQNIKPKCFQEVEAIGLLLYYHARIQNAFHRVVINKSIK